MAVRCASLIIVVVAVICLAARPGRGKSAGPAGFLKPLNFDSRRTSLSVHQLDVEHSTVEEVTKQIRSRRQAVGSPTPHGDHLFSGDGNRFARVYYSGHTSPVILVLTYDNPQNPIRTNLYRSTNYGADFDNISGQLGVPLWSNFYDSDSSNLVVFFHSIQSTIYISFDEGANWTTTNLSPNTINPRSFVWNPLYEQSAIAHDSVNNHLYVTQDLGQSWTKIAENVRNPSDYHWGNNYDTDDSVIYYNSYDPNDASRGDYTVGLYSQRAPYTKATQREFDPNLGRHDRFYLVGPYIFAQRNNSGNVHLYISYNRQPFNVAQIPSTDRHRGYYVSHINELQALVIVEHVSGLFNLYLSDITGVYFSLSLEDIAAVNRQVFDLELIHGINGTMIANRNERVNATNKLVRTVVTLDNGGEWNYVTPPKVDMNGAPLLCEPPSCSLHFHMASSEYARLGVYSQDSAPGIIIAHGNIGSHIDKNPDLYISRDGGVSWAQTLTGSWGVTVVDHGGLLVAADDYHKEPSRRLKYSCNEGISWDEYTYTDTETTIYGITTEPGEETTTVSLYGVKRNTGTWDVVTVNFSSIFPTNCTQDDYYSWQPWDARTDSDCILGQDVTLERRLPQQCCLIGLNYDRPINVKVCQCSIDDYECDYGFMPADGLDGPCVRDQAIPLDDPCADGQVKTIMKSRGYRKVAGDICINDGIVDFEPYEFTCCNATVVYIKDDNVSNATVVYVKGVSGGNEKAIVTGLAVALALVIMVAMIFGGISLFFMCRRRVRLFRVRTGAGSMQFRSVTNNSEESDNLLDGGDDDDDLPLAI